MKHRPMLACECEPHLLKYPLIIQPKLDGIRVLIHEGAAWTRTLKKLRNQHVQRIISEHAEILQGVDCEVMVGSPTNPQVYRDTVSGVMSEAGEPSFKLHVFDLWDLPDTPYDQRSWALSNRMMAHDLEFVELVDSVTIYEESQLMDWHQKNVALGYEGSILRRIDGKYKYNRSTMREGYLVKFKDFKDGEAVILGFEPRYHNANEATIDARGYTKRSSHQENKIAQDTLGALVVSRLIQGELGPTFRIGTGFDDALRKQIWDSRGTLVSKVVKFKYHDSARYDLPRFPVFLGFRDPDDL